ncbi:MAG TPA: DUF1592 domain-containing protein, partial [Planctomycetaceae bacterium]|nr:DUF1592 domain-containing protein [Planctomycetaceae bacterium]
PAAGAEIDVPFAVRPLDVRDAATQRVALIPPTGFRLEQRKAAEGSLTSISTDAFRQAWGGLLSNRNMELAFQIRAPVVLPIALVPRQAEQTVRADQVLRIHRGRIEWSLHAEIETKQAPAFQYVLHVDPRLRIESVSVKQEDAERLAHWAVTARERLVLFLKDATSDVQYLTLKGYLPVSRGVAVPVPTVRFENAKQLPGTLRVYRDPVDAESGQSPYELSDIELASRLSFFLWSSIPDERLLAVAERGELSNPATLEAEATRLLADPRATHALVNDFAAQWLNLRRVREVVVDPRQYPTYDETLLEAFIEEVERFVASTITEDQSVRALLDADYTFVNERLARHYGIEGVYGSRFRRVAIDQSDQRGGLLSAGALLATTS